KRFFQSRPGWPPVARKRQRQFGTNLLHHPLPFQRKVEIVRTHDQQVQHRTQRILFARRGGARAWRSTAPLREFWLKKESNSPARWFLEGGSIIQVARESKIDKSHPVAG